MNKMERGARRCEKVEICLPIVDFIVVIVEAIPVNLLIPHGT